MIKNGGTFEAFNEKFLPKGRTSVKYFWCLLSWTSKRNSTVSSLGGSLKWNKSFIFRTSAKIYSSSSPHWTTEVGFKTLIETFQFNISNASINESILVDLWFHIKKARRASYILPMHTAFISSLWIFDWMKGVRNRETAERKEILIYRDETSIIWTTGADYFQVFKTSKVSDECTRVTDCGSRNVANMNSARMRKKRYKKSTRALAPSRSYRTPPMPCRSIAAKFVAAASLGTVPTKFFAIFSAHTFSPSTSHNRNLWSSKKSLWRFDEATKLTSSRKWYSCNCQPMH